MPTAEPVPLDILYEDEDLMALNKPAGMVVHPTYRNTSGTLLNGILWHLRDRAEARPGLLSRLDKDTSGVVVVALSEGAHARMQRDAHAGLITKTYVALVHGIPEPREGRIALPLRRDPADRRRVIADPSGAASETRYRVVAATAGYSVVRCELVTGRTHQIRVHLAVSGWPILGDATYGSAHALIARQALHAASIAFLHPSTRERLTIDAALPADFAPFRVEFD